MITKLSKQVCVCLRTKILYFGLISKGGFIRGHLSVRSRAEKREMVLAPESTILHIMPCRSITLSLGLIGDRN